MYDSYVNSSRCLWLFIYLFIYLFVYWQNRVIFVTFLSHGVYVQHWNRKVIFIYCSSTLLFQQPSACFARCNVYLGTSRSFSSSWPQCGIMKAYSRFHSRCNFTCKNYYIFFARKMQFLYTMLILVGVNFSFKVYDRWMQINNAEVFHVHVV